VVFPMLLDVKFDSLVSQCCKPGDGMKVIVVTPSMTREVSTGEERRAVAFQV